ncbi:short chain dehydrogenase family protein [Mycobacterium kansasii]|uniref:Short chain dehydrogenase family protein n=1 Tax=Mycobacterium kansasii TaxID=1768 RepID=A0A1V3WD45_MYCKA|nr:short chain dehydrogenase family protein [Mycobacterium kansasii]
MQDKSILITGATGSLGSVAARALADAGARLTLTGGNAAGLAELVEDAGIDNAVVVERRPETRPTRRPWWLRPLPTTAALTGFWWRRA